MYCNNCGGQIYEGDNACRNCGAVVNNNGILNAQPLGAPVSNQEVQQPVASVSPPQPTVTPVQAPIVDSLGGPTESLNDVPAAAPVQEIVAPTAPAPVMTEMAPQPFNAAPVAPVQNIATPQQSQNVLPGMQPSVPMQSVAPMVNQVPVNGQMPNNIPNNPVNMNAPKKSNSKTILIVIIAILLVAIAVAVYFVFFADQESTKPKNNTTNNQTQNVTNNTNNETQNNTENEDEDETPNSGNSGTVVDGVSAEWKNYEVQIKGQKVTLPVSYDDLSRLTGFVYDEDDLNESLDDGYYTLANMYANDRLALYVELTNDSGSTKLYKEIPITRISQSEYQVVDNGAEKVVFPGGLVAGVQMTEDELFDILGMPDDIYKYEDDDYVSNTYTYTEDGSDYASANFYEINIVNGVIDEIQLDHRDY